MNPRVKELAEQAGGVVLAGSEIQKFAELIVRECMSIAQEYDGAKLGGPGLIIAMRIEQHFGVEE